MAKVKREIIMKEKMEKKKYCGYCHKHTLHKETKIK